MHWFLTDVVSTLLLPVFVLMILCSIAGVRPDGVLKSIFELIGALLSEMIKAIVPVSRSISFMFKDLVDLIKSLEKGPRKPIPPPKPRPVPGADRVVDVVVVEDSDKQLSFKE